jgi:energy-coupling factor transporter ATP-binding protein EcfA2
MSSPHIRIAGPARAFNPFPGLRPFEPEEDYIFFGREKQTDELMRKLRTTRFLSILGQSGSGKSSLVRSGLIPSLYGGGMTMAGSRWRVAIMRPGEDPLGNLAQALSEPGVLGPEGLPGEAGDSGLTRAFFETTLRASQRGLLECIQHARIGSGSNVLVLVDQFEELFRYKRSRRNAGRDEAVAFVKLLLEARQSEACYIAITMRSDFIGDCMELGGLPEAINDGIYLVPRMDRNELKLAITGPVKVGRAAITPRLVSRLLNDVGDDPDQLPILQHALMRTWERWEQDLKSREPLDLVHYEAIGTMKTALSRHAEEAFGELDANQQQVAERLFKALTDKESDARAVRRPAALREICARTGASMEQVSTVVDVFRKPGRSFLMPPSDVPLRPDSIIDLSHESLMRIWERLSVWADEEARSAQLYLGIAHAARRHAEGVAALWRDPELQLALDWRAKAWPTEHWAERYDPSFVQAMDFLDASMAERDRELREAEQRRRRELKNARVLVLILALASGLTFALGAYAFRQKIQAEQEASVAESALQRADSNRLRAEIDARKAHEAQERAEAERAKAAESEKRHAAERPCGPSG